MKNHENRHGTMTSQPWTMKNHEKTWKTMKNQPGTMKNHENGPGTMTTQPGTMKNHENQPGSRSRSLFETVGQSAHFSWQTDKQNLPIIYRLGWRAECQFPNNMSRVPVAIITICTQPDNCTVCQINTTTAITAISWWLVPFSRGQWSCAWLFKTDALLSKIFDLFNICFSHTKIIF